MDLVTLTVVEREIAIGFVGDFDIDVFIMQRQKVKKVPPDLQFHIH